MISCFATICRLPFCQLPSVNENRHEQIGKSRQTTWSGYLKYEHPLHHEPQKPEKPAAAPHFLTPTIEQSGH